MESVTAPYEAEMTAHGESVNNLWGQRITGLVPVGMELVASTANKNGAPFDARYAFLDGAPGREYGAAYRFHLPGHLSTPIAWKCDGHLNLEIELGPSYLSLSQNGALLAATPSDADIDRLRRSNAHVGRWRLWALHRRRSARRRHHGARAVVDRSCHFQSAP